MPKAGLDVHPGGEGRVLGLAAAVLLAFVPLLTVVPHWFPVDPDIASAANAVGYHSGMAYKMAAAAAILAVGLAAMLGRRRALEIGPDWAEAGEAGAGRRDGGSLFVEALVVVLAVVALYFPIFLARWAPYIEDSFVLDMLHRMEIGQRPFVDFEFLYGPLMIYPGHWWTELFGFSFASYYSYLAFIEAGAYVVLLLVLRRLIPGRGAALAAFVLMSVLCLNVLLGPNQNGFRKLLPVFALLLLADGPRRIGRWLPGAVLLGLQLSYSQEYAMAALAGAAALYAFLAVRERSVAYLGAGAAVGVAAMLTWVLVTWALMGDGFTTYLRETLYLTQRMASGQSTFEFYFTVNSLSGFALLAIACVIVGAGLGPRGRGELQRGDRFLLVAFAYTLISVKSALGRCDLWHVVPPFLALALAFLVPWKKTVMPVSRGVRRAALALLVVMAVTYTIGQAPAGSFFLRGWRAGLSDVLQGTARAREAPDTGGVPALEFERTQPRSEVADLAVYLSDPSRKADDVLFYADTWSLAKQVGVEKRYFSNDDFLHSEKRGQELTAFLRERPGARVVIRRPAFDRLMGRLAPDDFPEFTERYRMSLTKRIARWASTVHYQGLEVENPIREGRWRRMVGQYLRAEYEPVAEFGDLVVLARRGAGKKNG